MGRSLFPPLLLLLIVSPVFSFDRHERRKATTKALTNSTCFEYTLENECSTLVGLVDTSESFQQVVFNAISLNISDVRMLPRDCRRPILWYLCGLVFPPCPPESEAEQECRLIEGCLQVSALCEDYLTIECPFSHSDLENNSTICSQVIEQEIEEASADPIPVETCLDGEMMDIDCCIDPYVVGGEGECVVECFQYEYGKSMTLGISIVCMIAAWAGLVLLILIILPLCVLRVDMSYPNYMMILGILTWNLFSFFAIWSVFAGGPQEFICGNEISFEVAIESYSKSTRTGIQFSLAMFLNTFSLSCWALSAFNTICVIARGRFVILRKLVERPVPRSTERIILFLLILYPSSLTIYFLADFFTHNSASDTSSIFPAPFIYYPLADRTVFKVALMIPASIVVTMFLLFLLITLKTSFYLFYFHWRALFVSFYICLMYGFLVHILFFQTNPYEESLGEYVFCVASHPREDPSPCERKFDSGAVAVADTLVFFLASPIWGGVLFSTHPLARGWWVRLICKREITYDISLVQTQSALSDFASQETRQEKFKEKSSSADQ